MLTSVIFDLDGVLIDSHPAHRRAWHRLLRSIGAQVSEPDLDYVLEGRRRDDILRYFLGDLPASELAQYGQAKDQFFQEELPSIGTIAGLRVFLSGLANSGVSMAVASCGSSTRVQSHLKNLELTAFFKVIVGGDQVPDGKPHPAVYLKAVQELNVDCSGVVAVEDSVSGVLAAEAAGLKCLGIGDGRQAASLLAAGATRVVPSFLGLDTADISALLVAEERSGGPQVGPARLGRVVSQCGS